MLLKSIVGALLEKCQLTGRACCRAGIHCWSCPEPLLIKDIKVQVNKQKPNNVRPAQMKHNSDKMTIAPMSSQPCSKPDVSRSYIFKFVCS
jgi:hypothetical protein